MNVQIITIDYYSAFAFVTGFLQTPLFVTNNHLISYQVYVLLHDMNTIETQLLICRLKGRHSFTSCI